MLLIQKIFLFVALTQISSIAFAEPAKAPSRIYVTYKAINKICFVGPRDARNEIIWQDCSRKTDILKILRGAKMKTANDVLANVRLELNFTNAHQCTFDGNAFWSRDRLIAISAADANCKLAIYFFDGAAHIAASEQCRSQCGARGDIDGTILYR